MIEAMIASRSAVKRPSMGFNMPKKHVLAIGAVVVVAVAAAILIPGRGKAPTAPDAEQGQLPLGQAAPNGGANPSIDFAGSSQPMPLPLVGQSQPVMRGPLAEAAGGIAEGDDGGVPAVDGGVAQPPTVTTTAPPAGVPSGPAPVETPRPAPPVAAAKPAPVATPAPAPAANPVVKPVEKPVTLAKAAPGSSWYASQSANNYVVQLVGTSSEASAQNVVKEVGGESRYFKKTLNGKPFYVVTYGNFSSRDAAAAAIKNLPAKIQAGKPWPRTVASVQKELAAVR